MRPFNVILMTMFWTPIRLKYEAARFTTIKCFKQFNSVQIQTTAAAQRPNETIPNNFDDRLRRLNTFEKGRMLLEHNNYFARSLDG